MSDIIVEHLSKTFPSKDGTVEALKNVNLEIIPETYTGSSECRAPAKVPLCGA